MERRLTDHELRALIAIDALECPRCHAGLSAMYAAPTWRTQGEKDELQKRFLDWEEEAQGTWRLAPSSFDARHAQCPACGQSVRLDCPVLPPIPLSSLQDGEEAFEYLRKVWDTCDIESESVQRAARLGREAIEASRRG